MPNEVELMMEFEEDGQKGKFLTFFLANEVYGIEIRFVTEIVGLQAITEVPELPSYIRGIINLRGKIIPVMDVRARFGKELREYDERTCVIVIEVQEIAIGLIVDSVAEVMDISEENIVPPPQVSKGYHHKYIKGIGKVGNEVKLLLDCDRLLNDEEVGSLVDIG